MTGALLACLLFAPEVHAGLGTVFSTSAEDPVYNPNDELACVPGRRLRLTDLVVAHPTIPCGAKVLVMNPANGRRVVTRVADRGPRAAALDMAPAVRRALRHSGYGPVVFVVLDGRRISSEKLAHVLDR